MQGATTFINNNWFSQKASRNALSAGKQIGYSDPAYEYLACALSLMRLLLLILLLLILLLYETFDKLPDSWTQKGVENCDGKSVNI